MYVFIKGEYPLVVALGKSPIEWASDRLLEARMTLGWFAETETPRHMLAHPVGQVNTKHLCTRLLDVKFDDSRETHKMLSIMS